MPQSEFSYYFQNVDNFCLEKKYKYQNVVYICVTKRNQNDNSGIRYKKRGVNDRG